MSAPCGDAQQQQQLPSVSWCSTAGLGCDGCSKAKSLPNTWIDRCMCLLVPCLLPRSLHSHFPAGVKRSASGEVAAFSAKKQKTSPLAAYQQAQEHLRNQNARHVRK